MSYLAPQMSLSNVTATDPLSVPLLPLDSLEQRSNYDAETFIGSEDAFVPQTFHPPKLRRFTSTYEDPFSDALSTYDHPNQDQNGADSPSIERDNKLLSFSLPTLNYTLLDYAYRRTTISFSAQLHGMFFLAESPWASAADVSATPTELTCYRRNLFQTTGTITLPRTLRCIMTEQGEQIPILGQELTISATESVEGNPVKIISVPWKTPATNVPVAEDKVEKEPPPIPLDLSNGQDIDSDFVSFPIAWKRLQFRIATANNGRRKELQQHFVVRLKVIATLATGARVTICEVQSGPIIVRGRSPRNFQSRRDFPISGGGSTARKSSQIPAQTTRTSIGEPAQQHQHQRSESKVEISQIPHQFDFNEASVSPNFFEWNIPTGQVGAMTAIPPDAASYAVHESAAAYAQSSPDLTRYPQPAQRPLPSQPIKLDLTDEEPKKPSSPIESAKKAPRLSQIHRPPSFSINVISSPDESADLLYEYFPLGLDDWMPPVDAVYRPHVVHHTNVPQDPKAMAAKSRSKRYFSADQD
ncbi:hypothetical protein H2201_006034 [Coniosporium apollinis]|uniref:NDT80 domain-containing protein n=2 Tax=Coniosporium TaxID=2810619 RepID=A0ABQ9NRJ1_9PEZI|nr:hypothetical protein H2199_002936 [Cladosporium sp. JES 115]KAJ9662546.1 hypothetical protein H2201_006034 [Coniosporium apollinis]